MTPSPPPNDRLERFEQVALPHLSRVYNVALRLARRPEDASDLAQETYLRAFRTFDNFRTGTDCKAWLLTILYSVFINRYWKGKRNPTVPLEVVEERGEHLPATASGDAEAGMLRALDADRTSADVVKALGDLPEAFRAAVLLVDVEEMSYEEASQVLDCPVGTLRSRLYRARKMLFTALKGFARAAGYVKMSGEA